MVPIYPDPFPHIRKPITSPKRKRRRIQFVNYFDDVTGVHGKQKKQTRHKKFRVKPDKYSMTVEEDDDFFFFEFANL